MMAYHIGHLRGAPVLTVAVLKEPMTFKNKFPYETEHLIAR